MNCSATAEGYSGSVPTSNIFSGTRLGSPITTSSVSETPGFTVTCDGDGQIIVSVSPHAVAGMTARIYEITIKGSYVFLGEKRTWYQFYGIVNPYAGVTTSSMSSTSHSTSTSVSTSTSTSTTTSIPEFPTGQLALVAVVVCVIALAYVFGRRVPSQRA